MKCFPDLSEILSLLCFSEDPNDPLSLNSAILLGKLCVVDENATTKLRQVIADSKDTHVKAQVGTVKILQLVG